MELSRFCLAALMGVAWLCASARGGVLVVGPPSVGGAYSTIQQAVDAAQDGDVILVHSATSPAFTIDGKGLTVQGWPGRTVQVQGTITVRNVPASGITVLDGLSAKGTPVFPKSTPGLFLESNPGLVRVQGCTLMGGDGTGNSSCYIWGGGGNGATIESTPKVLLEGCTITGGYGYGDPVATCTGGPGGHGVQSSGSALVVYDCKVTGGVGGTSDLYPGQIGGQGGDGVRTTSWGVFVSGGRVKGGDGGSGGHTGGPGGDGMHVDAAQARILDAVVLRGEGGYNYYSSIKGVPGLPTSGTGTFAFLPGDSVALDASSVASDEDHLVLEVNGQADHDVWLFIARRPDQRWLESFSGFAAFPVGTRTTQLPIGRIPWTGKLILEVPAIPPPGDAGAMWIQAMVRSPEGQYVLSSPRIVTVLDAAGLQPDCNANGKLDLCDILNESSQDIDESGVPDECEAQHTTWFVDASAPGGGNGSVGAPFQALQQAFSSASSFDTILVADGVYTGPANRDLTSNDRTLRIKSRNGPAACIIDLQQQPRAMSFMGSGPQSEVRIEGFTFLGASDSAIYALNRGIEVVDCVFDSCSTPNYGGAMRLYSQSVRVSTCRFVGNTASSAFTYGGGAIYLAAGSPNAPIVLEDSSFEVNRALRGGAVYLDGSSANACSISRCTFLGNSASQEGGALFVSGSQTTQVESCLLAGNIAVSGGAIAVSPYSASGLAVHLCTVVSNQASSEGGAVLLSGMPAPYQPSVDCLIADSIFWDNVAALGSQVRSSLAQNRLDVRFTDLQGGQSGVSVVPGGTLVWGAGNLNVDPSFADPDGPDNNPATLADNDWRLGPFSACIDSGSNPLVPQDAIDQDGDGHFAELTPFDLDGQARRVDDPAVPDTGVGQAPIVDLGAYEKH